jgi:hypothetical protein
MDLALKLNDAADYYCMGAPANFLAGVGAIAALRPELVRVHGPLGLRINDSDIGDGAGFERAAVNAEHPRGLKSQLFDKLRPSEMAGLN